MKKNFTHDLVKITYYGIEENIDDRETVEVNLRDLLKIHATLEELNRFFHQQEHYSSLDDIRTYLGSYQSSGALKLINDARMKLAKTMLPQELNILFDQGAFDAPESPYYFRVRGNTDGK